jgi:cytochrome c553
MRIQFKNGKVQSQEKLLLKQFGRLRTVTEGPDGYLYISTSQQDPPEGWPKAGCDMILRIRPKANYKISHGNYALSKTALPKNTADRLYVQMCGSCHGNSMEGTDRGPSLSLANRKHGKTRAEVLKNIRNGILDKGMPSWAGAIPDSSIERITDMIIKKGK